ncbi:MAG: hypothetical protein Q9176_005890 [Flavoplaca citrina]
MYLSPHLYSLYTLLSFLTLTSALAISSPSTKNITALPPPTHLGKFNPLPNPYSIPASPISLDFDSRPESPLSRSAVITLLTLTRRALTRRIQIHGDGPIPFGVQGFHTQGVQITYDSAPQWRVMLYSDVRDVLRGVYDKMQQEGYRERTAVVIHAGPGGEIETGEVDIGKVVGTTKGERVAIE